MSGGPLNATDARRVGRLLRAYEGGMLGPENAPSPQTRNDMPPSIVAMLIQSSDVRGTGTLIGVGAVAALNWNTLANDAVVLQPLDERVMWIRVLGGPYPPASPHPPAVFQLKSPSGQIGAFTIEDTPEEVREKLIGMGLPDRIEVRGRGSTFENDGSVWNQFVAWAVRFPGDALDQTASNPFPLEWYDNPDIPGSAITATARIDDYPYWPRLDQRVYIWKAIPSSDVVPAGAFVRASWLWGRGYVVDEAECVL